MVSGVCTMRLWRPLATVRFMPDDLTSSDVRAGTMASGPDEALETTPPIPRSAPEAPEETEAAIAEVEEGPAAEEPREDPGGSTEAFRAFVEAAEPAPERSAAPLIATMAVAMAVLAVLLLLFMH